MLVMPVRFSAWRGFAALTVVLLFGLSIAVQALAQASPEAGSGKLESVKVTGSTRFPSEQIAPATGLKPDAVIAKADLQRGADRLAQLGPFASVQYRYSTTDAGVRAEYQVTDAPAVPVWFDNFPGFTDAELIAALKASIVLFDGTAPERGTLLDDMSDALQTLLATRGMHPSVTHSLITAPTSGQRVQQFRAEGPVLNIASVEFTDPFAQTDRGIQTRTADLVGHPFSRTALELFEFEQVRPAYLSHGFLRVQFGPPTARFVGAGNDARVAVTAPIEPGPVFAWNGTVWSGNSAISAAQLDRFATLKSGDPVDGMKVEAIWQSVRDAYAARGYLEMNLNAVPQFDDNVRRVTYDVAITEGSQYRMGKLVLTGLSIEGDRRIRAAWTISPGEIFDKSIYDEFFSSGIKQAFTGLPFHYEKIGRFFQEDPQAGTVDVLIDFQ
jgi:outer membrane protein assembly factor BamA